jgi:hypothetical protein
MLQIELSTCQFSRGKLQQAYELGLAATQGLSAMPNDHDARIIAMKSVFDQINDLSFGEAPPALLAIHARALEQFCTECEANQRESVRDLAYKLGGEALEMIIRIPAYRESPLLQPIADELRALGERDPHAESRPHTRNALRNRLLEEGKYQEVLDRIQEWRSLDGGIHNDVIFDGMKVVAELHTSRFQDALAGIAKIVSLKPYGQHLLIFTHEALKKVAKALYETIPTAAGPDAEALRQSLDQVLTRYYQLGGSPNPEPASSDSS